MVVDRYVVLPLGLLGLLGCTPRPSADLGGPATVPPEVRAPEASGVGDPGGAKPRWVDLSVESEFGCAVERTGSVFCWGRGPSANMQLRTLPDQPTSDPVLHGARKWGPASRVDLIHDARKVSTANGVACAIVEDGRVRCWGAVQWGSQHVYDVPGLEGAVDLEVGDTQSCATLAGGALWCWGAEEFGVPRPRLEGAVAVTVGDNLGCGLTKLGDVVCWGQGVADWHRYNTQFNQAQAAPGQASVAQEDVPETLEVGRFRNAVDLALSGWNTLCVLRSDGKVMCSEKDLFAALRGEDLGMHEIEGTLGITDLDASRYHACGRSSAGGALCWGRNAYGQLGDGGSVSRERAAPVVELSDIVDLSVSEDFSCASTRDDRIACWGFDRGEALAREDIHIHTVEGLRASSIAAAQHSTCAVDDNDQLRYWGSEQLDQIGIASVTNPTIVGLPQPGGEILGFDPGWESCFLMASGTLQCGTWAGGAFPSSFIPGLTIPDVVALANGQPPACRIIGSGRKAQLNCGDSVTQLEPDDQLTAPFDVSVFGMRGCVAHSAGKVSCFAENHYWGDGPRPTREFNRIAGITDATAVSSASGHDCALGKNGRVRCWTGRAESEWNEEKRMATAMHYRGSEPQDMGLEQIVEVVSGAQHHCALSRSGEVRCWDDNPYAEDIVWLSIPELGPDIVELAAGSEHTCVRDKAGKVTCWGEDIHGQLGRVPSRVYLSPTTMKID